MADFDEAKDKIMLGAERKSMVMSKEDRKLAAYHEAGHAIVAKLLPGAQPIHKATIIPRGQTMGMVSFLADERHSVSETRLRTHLATALGGCCAESLIFKERSTGAQGDYKQVTALARSMVCEWGMSKQLGPLSFGNEEEEVFLGKEFARTRNFSEQTAQAIDQEIRDLVLAAEETAAGLLEKNQDKLHALAHALLRFEMLDDAEIDNILALGPPEVEGGEPSVATGSPAGERNPGGAGHWRRRVHDLDPGKPQHGLPLPRADHGHSQRNSRLLFRWRPLPRAQGRGGAWPADGRRRRRYHRCGRRVLASSPLRRGPAGGIYPRSANG